MSARLAALLSHPQLTGLVALAGPADAQVSGTRVLVQVPIPGDGPLCAVGEVVVVLGALERFDWALDVLVRRAAADSASALVITGRRALEPATAALADRMGLPVLGAADPWALAVVVHSLLDGAHTRGVLLARDVARAGQRAGPGLDELLAALSAALHHRVVLLDAAGHLAAGPTGDVDALPAGEARAALVLSAHDGPTSVPLPGAGVLVACPVGTAGQVEAWLAAALAGRIPAEEAAVALALQVAVAAVGHRLALRRMAEERDARYRISLLGELLETTGRPSAHVVARALAAGWRLEGWHTGIHLTARTSVDEVARRTDVLSAFAAEGLDVRVVEQANGWAAWTTTATEPTPALVEKTSAALRRAQRHLAAVLQTQVGVGRARTGPRGLATTLAEAADAAHLAGNRAHTGRFIHVDRLGMAQLMLAWTQTDTFAPAARELLAPLAGARGQVLQTLQTYLDEESSITATAARLGVHRNTVTERIARAQRLLAVDLKDPETRLALQLACRSAGLAVATPPATRQRGPQPAG